MSPSDSDDAAMLPADTAAEDKEGLMPVATADNAQVEPPPKKRRPRRLKAIDPVAGEPGVVADAAGSFGFASGRAAASNAELCRKLRRVGFMEEKER